MLNKHHIEYASIKNPFDDTFNNLMNHVNQLECCVPIPMHYFSTPIHEKNDYDMYDADYTVNVVDILFENNSNYYYGNRRIVYNEINLLREIMYCADFSHPIVLNGCVPKYVMNLYINSCYTNRFDINRIEPSDIKQFIKFIDQYPTRRLSLEILECDIIKYFDEHHVTYDEFMTSLILRYRLKFMYLHQHNYNLTTRVALV